MLISHFHPSKYSYTGFALFNSIVGGKSFTIFPSISYAVHTGILSRYPNTSTNDKTTSVAPCTMHPYLVATVSNQPTLLGLPVFAPYSPPLSLNSFASSPKISVVKAPAPTHVEYAFTIVYIFLIS